MQQSREDGNRSELEKEGDWWVYKTDESAFEGKAFIEKSFVLKWEPPEGIALSEIPKPVPLSIEIPVIFRAWEDKREQIETNYFPGADIRSVEEYERMLGRSRQFERPFGSRLLRLYYEKIWNRDTYPPARRAVRQALNATYAVSTQYNKNWLGIPSDLPRLLDPSWSGKDDLATLQSNIMAIKTQIFSDLNGIEVEFASFKATCGQRRHFFEYISSLAQTNPDLVKKRFPEGISRYSSIMDEKQRITLHNQAC